MGRPLIVHPSAPRPRPPRGYVRPLLAHPADATLRLVQLTRGYFATIDAADAAEVGKHNWHAAQGWRTMYAQRHLGGGVHETLHTLVARLSGMDAAPNVDHENGDGLDCRRANLRAASKAQNAWNAGLPRTNTSGIKGVTLHRQTGKWQAQLRASGSYRYLGLFGSIEDAALAVSAARRELHGSFARDA